MKYHSTDSHVQKETPLDEKLRAAFADLIRPGYYITQMEDDSMSPYIPRGSILIMEEDQAIGSVVEVIWREKRWIRYCYRGGEDDHWLFLPLNLNKDRHFEAFTSTPKNIKGTRIIGRLAFYVYFGKRNRDELQQRISKLLEAGDIRKLLKISEFKRIVSIDDFFS